MTAPAPTPAEMARPRTPKHAAAIVFHEITEKDVLSAPTRVAATVLRWGFPAGPTRRAAPVLRRRLPTAWNSDACRQPCADVRLGCRRAGSRHRRHPRRLV